MSEGLDERTRDPAADSDAVTSGLGRRIAIALAAGSSAAVLVLELVSLRLVAPYLGLTLETNTAVIGVALTAIAVGAALGGRFADLVSPVRSIGPVLLVAGALVLVILPVVRWTGEAVRGGSGGVVFAALAVALFLPAALLSAVTPMVTKLRLATLAETGTVVGRLSAYATGGAIAGTVLTGFVFVAQVPTSVIVIVLGGLLVAAGTTLTVWLHRGRRRAVVVPLVLALAGSGATVLAPRPCDVETAYHCARVAVDPNRPSGRTLYLDDLRHSYIDLADPTHLEYEITRYFGSALDALAAGPVQALHIGGGGLTMPRYLSATRAGSRNRVYEIDRGVVDLDVRELGARLGDGVDGPDVRVRDARTGIRDEPAGGYDVVITDAFGGVAVPWHLTTEEMVGDVARVLRPGGLYLVNLVDDGPLAFARAEVRTIGAGFRHVAVLAKPDKLAGRAGGTFVVLASDQPLPAAAILSAAKRRVPDAAWIGTPAEITEFVGDAPLLTDDYAPVDQLLTPRRS